MVTVDPSGCIVFTAPLWAGTAISVPMLKAMAIDMQISIFFILLMLARAKIQLFLPTILMCMPN